MGNEKHFTVLECTHSGRVIRGFSCPAFVRGIGKDNYGFIYILCSGSNSRVIKLNSDFNSVGITSHMCCEYFGVSYGMLVTSDNILVTSYTKDLICVLDLNLNHQYNLRLSQSPYGIATLDNKYFVTYGAAIGVIDINFEEKTCREKKVEYIMMKKDGKREKFKAEAVFREICVSDHYVFVTEVPRDHVGGRLLCLQYNERRGHFTMVAKQDDLTKNCSKNCSDRCCPVVVAAHNNSIYYTQGSYGGMFHIVKANMSGTSIDSETLFDVS